MTGSLTVAYLLHRPERADRWIRFGHPAGERHRGRHGIAWFEPGQIFGYVDWRAGPFGTVEWSFSVVRCLKPGAVARRLPGIRPGGELLLRATGAGAVKRAFAYLDGIDAAEVDPAEIDPSHWVAAANRLAARQKPRPFDRLAHTAAIARRALLG